MAEQIMQVGPRIGEISRRTGVHKETLRYRFHKFILRRGFVIQANLDYHRLGLKRLVIFAKLAPKFEEHAVTIMSALSEMCYLTGFAEETLEGTYIMQVTVPSELREECGRLYRTLRDIGIFTEMQVASFEEVRSVPMKPGYYDFFEGTWAYDWQREGTKGAPLVPSGRAEVEKYDLSDLLILKELNIDANRTLVALAKKLNISYKTLVHHYTSHVIGRGLIKSYKVLWQGTRYNPKTEKAESKSHSYLAIALLVRGTSDGQRAKLMASLNQVPFLWFEASDPEYYAEFFVPIGSYADFLRRIRDLTHRTGMKPRLLILDQSKALRFTISYRLFDQEKRAWRLDAADVVARFGNLVVSVNGQAGGV
jgi:DNA-binding Lrp family transcriptional regulator